jgi:hypothetical protein
MQEQQVILELAECFSTQAEADAVGRLLKNGSILGGNNIFLRGSLYKIIISQDPLPNGVLNMKATTIRKTPTLKDSLTVQSLMLNGLVVGPTSQMTLTPIDHCIADVAESSGIDLEAAEDNIIMANMKIAKSAMQKAVLAAVVTHLPKACIGYSEERSRREEHVEAKVALERAKRVNNNKRHHAEQFSSTKTYKMMDYKPSNMDIIDFKASFHYNANKSNVQFPNWRTNNQLLKRVNEGDPNAGMVKVVGRLRGIHVDISGLQAGTCEQCGTKLRIRTIEKVTSDYYGYIIMRCERLIKGPDEYCGYHCLIEHESEFAMDVDDGGFINV